MRPLLLACCLAGAIGSPLGAQRSTAETLYRAVILYEELQLERAVTLFRQVISPSASVEATPAERVQAYKYLGASLALQGRSDSAFTAFRMALERDPFTDLDARSFTAREREVFARARRSLFRIGLQPVQQTRFDPRTDEMTFTYVTTQNAAVHAVVRPVGDTMAAAVFDRTGDELRDIAWNGFGRDGHLVPAGRYELWVSARSELDSTADSAKVYFEVRHDFPQLEDTLPSLGPADLLPERFSRGSARVDLLKGIGLAAGALVIPVAIANSDLGGSHGGSHAKTIAGAAVATGALAFVYRQQHRDIPANVAENARRRSERMMRNAEIARRNAEKLALTRIEITPAAGVTP